MATVHTANDANMVRLAFISLVTSGGRNVALPASEVAYVSEHHDGATITLRDGRSIETTSTVAQVVTAIDTLWDEYTAALGNP